MFRSHRFQLQEYACSESAFYFKAFPFPRRHYTRRIFGEPKFRGGGRRQSRSQVFTTQSKKLEDKLTDIIFRFRLIYSKRLLKSRIRRTGINCKDKLN